MDCRIQVMKWNERFLGRINSSIKWEKCFPTVNKTKLVKGAKKLTPIRDHSGVTGEALVRQMLNFLTTYGRERDFDYILLIDDVDCRFKDGEETLETWNVRVGSEVSAALGQSDHPLLKNGYSKSVHGSAMLGQIEPSVIAETCRTFCAPVFRELQSMAELKN